MRRDSRGKALDLNGQDIASVGICFGIPDAPCLATVPVKSAPFSVTRIDRDFMRGDEGRIRLPAATAYFLMLYLEDALHCDVMPDGSCTAIRHYERGSLCLVDLCGGASIELHSELHALAFMLPQALFDEIADYSSTTRRRRLRCRRGELDSVISNLGVALLAMFEGETVSPPALLQYLATAICAHLLQDYSDAALRNGISESALSSWQEKAAKDLMLENLAEDLPLSAIAEATGLSTGHFAQEFKKATGSTPHQWLTLQRIEQAKHLLRNEVYSLRDVAGLCGFTDQSHFTKVFSRSTGMTPAVWRKAIYH
ncbi:helix-turn-helix transcriptional regulator [Rhizobium daejeonense]|uniref:Helix-turn-helix transcriptional regulator n=1 Tax=Rhizobium daejeonense TaxID=240521 RepID=A0A6M1RVC0_9HYPH|nr:helix-turn-helix transcriptional regulator [Rhizobium daejeonense]